MLNRKKKLINHQSQRVFLEKLWEFVFWIVPMHRAHLSHNSVLSSLGDRHNGIPPNYPGMSRAYKGSHCIWPLKDEKRNCTIILLFKTHTRYNQYSVCILILYLFHNRALQTPDYKYSCNHSLCLDNFHVDMENLHRLQLEYVQKTKLWSNPTLFQNR